MKSILEELHNGSVYPAELICSADPDYRDTHRKISEETKYFTAEMCEENRQRFDDLQSLYNHSSFLHGTESFIHGFRLATLIMIEVYTGKGKMTHNDE